MRARLRRWAWLLDPHLFMCTYYVYRVDRYDIYKCWGEIVRAIEVNSVCIIQWWMKLLTVVAFGAKSVIFVCTRFSNCYYSQLGRKGIGSSNREMMCRRAQVPWISAQVIMTSTAIQVGGICTSQGQQGSLEQAGIAVQILHGKLSYSA